MNRGDYLLSFCLSVRDTEKCSLELGSWPSGIITELQKARRKLEQTSLWSLLIRVVPRSVSAGLCCARQRCLLSLRWLYLLEVSKRQLYISAPPGAETLIVA